MKRYSPTERVGSGYRIASDSFMKGNFEGNWVKLSDVTATMIPRPSPEEARLAVGDLMQKVKDAQTSWFVDHPDSGKYQALCIEAKAEADALLRLMGVEE